MNIEELKIAIREMIATHPDMEPSKNGHNVHMERYQARTGANLGVELDLKSKVNVFVERSGVNLARLADMAPKEYFAKNYGASKPNHDLFGHKSFSPSSDLLSYAVTDLWQFARIIHEVAGEGAKS